MLVFSAKIRILVHFRFVTHNSFPESASGKHFQGLGMRASDFLHKITLIMVIFRKIF
jgi:hypothetical protein